MIYIINYMLMILIAIMLFGAGIADIKRLAVSRLYIAAMYIVCILTLLTTKSPDLIGALSGAVVGICTLGISIISDEQIGKGDGLIIAALGLVLGFRGCLSVVCIASMIMCLVAVILLAFKKAGKKTKLPFIPALFAGYTIFFVFNYTLTGAAVL